MYEGFKLRERRKAHYIQWLLVPHYGKKVPEVKDILGFDDDDSSILSSAPKRVPREVQAATLAELEKELL